MSEIGFVDVFGAVEPEAIARGVAMNAHRRLGEVVTQLVDWLDEADNALNQLQKIELASVASMCFDGLERDVVDTLTHELGRISMDTGGSDA